MTAMAERAVRAVAPDETDLFPVLADAYLANPKRALAADRIHDEVLGFGVDVASMIVTTVAMFTAQAVLQRLADIVVDRAAAHGRKAIVAAVRKLARLDLPSDPGDPAPLTAEQLAQLHLLAVAKATEVGLDPVAAVHLADALVGGLLGSPSAPTR